jgi:L,D-transpeptidase YcbB
MKKMYLILIATTVAFYSCDNFGIFQNTAEDSVSTSANVVIRDYSITAENAYSDLFLDSTAVENYISSKNIIDTAARHIRNFYAVRNYQFAWFTSEGFTEEGLSVYNIYNKSRKNIKNNENTLERIDSLITQDSLTVSSTDSSYVQTELALTNTFVQHQNQFIHSENGNQLYYLIPIKKMDPLQLADSLSQKQFASSNADTASTGDSASVSNVTAYKQMQEQLQKYVSITKNGGWQPVPADLKSARKGASSPSIALLKKRLQLTGDYISNDTSQVFSDTLQVAIKDFQTRNGLKNDGLITDTLITILNVPAEQRLQQILLNLNRMQWLQKDQSENRVVVNIPEYMLHVYEGGNKAFEMQVVVGKEGSNTVMFNSNINQVVFSPYWNIPQSIVRDEIAPAMKNNPNYLKSRNMEIVNNSSNDSIPQIRQLPGAQNSLGKVKFLFPNRYDIYLHDTPEKDLFQKENRAFSHGCIRVADAEKLAQHLLKDQPEWTPEKVKQAMNAKTEQQVQVKNPVAVSITYLTAWVDANGKLNFRNDLYGHDQQTARRMFTNSSLASTPATQTQNDTSRLSQP